MAMIPLGQPFPPQGHIQGGPNSRPGGRPGPRRGKQPRRRKAAPGYHPHGAGKRSKMDFWLILVIIVALIAIGVMIYGLLGPDMSMI